MVGCFGVHGLCDAVVTSMASDCTNRKAVVGVTEGMPHKLPQAGGRGGCVPIDTGAAGPEVPVATTFDGSFEPWFRVVEYHVSRAPKSESLSK